MVAISIKHTSKNLCIQREKEEYKHEAIHRH